jgi:spore coat protein H
LPEVPAELARQAIPVYDLRMAASDIQKMAANAFSDETLPGVFVGEGLTFENVKVRHRGAWARTWPKKPIKVFFEKEKPFRGSSRLNLNSCWRDPAFIREHLAYELFAACGVPSPKSRMVRLTMNGRFNGLYVDVEQVNNDFLKRVNLRGAALFKAVSGSADERVLGSAEAYARHYEVETREEEGAVELQRFCQDLAQAGDVVGFFQENVDVDRYINYLAVCVLIQHWDGFNKNHYVAYDGQGSKKWLVIPWDLDRTFGDHWHGGFHTTDLPIMLGTMRLPGVTGWNRLADRFLNEPVLRDRFLLRLEELLEREFTAEKLFPVIDRLEGEIRGDAALDRRVWPSGAMDVREGMAELKRVIEGRRKFLLREIPKLKGRG